MSATIPANLPSNLKINGLSPAEFSQRIAFESSDYDECHRWLIDNDPQALRHYLTECWGWNMFYVVRRGTGPTAGPTEWESHLDEQERLYRAGVIS